MSANITNSFGRTAGTVEDKSGVEIYINTTALSKTIIQYVYLLGRLNTWGTVVDAHNQGLQNNTSGNTTKTYGAAYKNFNQVFYDELFNRTSAAIGIMRDNALVKAKDLIVQCENFYEIIVGNAADAEGSVTSTLTPILYLDATYYDNGTIESYVDNATFQLNNISAEDDTLEGILNSLNYKDCLDNCSADIENIHVDCKNNVRLLGLFMAFKKYVEGVRAFNGDIETSFDPLINRACALDNTRTYEYPYITSDSETAVLDRMLRDELYEMGLTDEIIDNATKKSSFTLNSLAKAMEEVIAEDKVQENGGKGIALFVGVISGNSKESYDKYGKELADSAGNCWKNISIYHMGLLHTECNDGCHRFKEGEGDEAYVNYMNEMNAALQSNNSIYVMKALKGGAFNAIKECAEKYLKSTTLTSENDFIQDEYREIYRKNFLAYDSYNFIYQKMSEDELMNKAPIIEDDVRTGKYKLYNIESMRYDNAGIHFTIMESSYTHLTDKSIADGSVEYKANQFEMNIQTHIGYSGVNEALSIAGDSERLRQAYEEQRKMIEKMEKDGLLVVTSATAGPLAAEGLTIGLNALDGDMSENDIKDIVKPGSREMTGHIINNHSSDTVGKGKNATYRGAGVLFDAYDYMSSSAAENAKDLQEANNYARLAGSAGYCTVVDTVDGKTTTQIYADNHFGLYTPGHEKAFVAVSTDGVGLKDICGWDEAKVKKIEDYLESIVEESEVVTNNNVGNDLDYQASVEETEGKKVGIDMLKSIIEGGYEINENTDFTELNNGLRQIEDAYVAVETEKAENKTDYGVYEAWDREIEDFTDGIKENS